LIDLETLGVKNLTNDSAIDFAPAWSPDGEKISFLVSEGDFKAAELQIMDADGKNRITITDFPAGMQKIDWSPDGQQIAFSSYDDGCGDIYSVRIDGTDLKRLTDLPGCAKSPTWSPDGEYIAFLASEKTAGRPSEMGWEVFVMMADGSGVTLLADKSILKMAPDGIIWSPVPVLKIGSSYSITELGSFVNLRGDPSLEGKVLVQLQPGDIITINDGPVKGNEYYWWKVSTSGHIDGWLVDVAGWYKLLE